MNVKTIFRAAMPFCFLILLSCTAEDKTSLNGIMNLRLAADYSVVPVTKADESGTQAPDSVAPDVKDFAITILDADGKEMNHWDKFSDFPQSVMLPVKSYTLKASYGDPDGEGFDKPYFEGQEPFTIKNEEQSEVNVTCMIANAKVTVEYSAAFKKYFKSYQTTIQSGEKGKAIVFEGDETREAYVKPGSISIIGAYVKQDGKTAEFKLDGISEAKARYHYRIKLDVEAGGQSLNISYDNTTEQVPVGIDISDGALSTKAPFFTLTGYRSEEAIQVPSYSPAPDKISALLTARGGIATCTLSVASACLQNQGWPESIDLLKASDVQRKLMADLGLKLTGLGANADKMAVIDFTDVIPSLYVYNNSADHIFTLKATDKMGKESEAVVLKITSGAFDFGISVPQAVPAGSSEVLVPVSLTESSDISLITFKYQGGSGVWNEAAVKEVVSQDGTNYTLRVSVPVGNEPVKLKAFYNGVKESNVVTVPVTDYNYTLSVADAADIWASKAILTLNAADKDLPQIQKSLKAYVKASSGNWEEKPATVEGNRVTVTSLQAGTAYQLKTSCVGATAENITMQPAEFTTEVALQVPNAGMEEWYSNKTDKNGNEITKNRDKVYWDKWFPWSASNEESQGWNTLNEKTTQDGGAPTVVIWPTPPYVGCCYVANSGTKPTADSHSGSKAAIIRSVGWGSGSAAASSAPKRTDAGYLYLGRYNSSTQSPDYGISFTSRPTALSFYCKYVPKNSADKFIARIVVMDEGNNVIAEAQLPESECGAIGSYIQKRVELSYTDNAKKAAKMYIVFQSGTHIEANKTDFDYPPSTNLSDGEFLGSQLYVDDIQLIY